MFPLLFLAVDCISPHSGRKKQRKKGRKKEHRKEKKKKKDWKPWFIFYLKKTSAERNEPLDAGIVINDDFDKMSNT